MYGAVEVVFLVRHLHASPTQVGVVYTLGAIGGILGALFANRLAQWIGSARIVWVSILATAPFMFAGVFAFPGWGIGLISVSAAAGGFGALVYNVAQVSLPAVDLPAAPARPDERRRAVHRLGLDAPGRPGRRGPGQHHRRPGDACSSGPPGWCSQPAG